MRISRRRLAIRFASALMAGAVGAMRHPLDPPRFPDKQARQPATALAAEVFGSGVPGPPVAAMLLHGRWGVECPQCPAIFPAAVGSEVFRCRECGIDCRILWPEREMRLQIERIVSLRPKIENHNWEPGETLALLVAENLEHGLPGGLD